MQTLPDGVDYSQLYFYFFDRLIWLHLIERSLEEVAKLLSLGLDNLIR